LKPCRYDESIHHETLMLELFHCTVHNRLFEQVIDTMQDRNDGTVTYIKKLPSVLL